MLWTFIDILFLKVIIQMSLCLNVSCKDNFFFIYIYMCVYDRERDLIDNCLFIILLYWTFKIDKLFIIFFFLIISFFNGIIFKTLSSKLGLCSVY